MAHLHGKSLIAGKPSPLTGETFRAVCPIDQSELPGDFLPATPAEASQALAAARAAFPSFRASSGETRAIFLETIAENLLALGDTLIRRAHLETGLAESRLHAELGRTTGHLRMFAAIARDDSWRALRHEPGDPSRLPLPKSDLRRTHQPIGPVVVFGSSNFPLAYSVAGGDTASALATGNPVVVKAHEAHPGTSELVAGAIAAAVLSTGLPPGIFSLLQGTGKLLAAPLVSHPDTRAVGFTGSTTAARILMDIAARRPDPIPVFAEMGSLNPIVVLPSALARHDHFAKLLIHSVTNDAGQFCTKPGIILIPEGDASRPFLDALAAALANVTPVPMLHRGIHTSFADSVSKLLAHPSVTLLASKPAAPGTLQGSPHLFLTHADTFLADESLRHEIFGPLALLVLYPAAEKIVPILRTLGGQLTATVFSSPEDPSAADLLPLLSENAGRVIFNGVPTGVEVNPAIQHGGPWPACSDSRFSAVGPDALLRFVRPVAWQNLPENLVHLTVG